MFVNYIYIEPNRDEFIGIHRLGGLIGGIRFVHGSLVYDHMPQHPLC